MRPELVQSTIRRYVCAVCWGLLIERRGADGEPEVVCYRHSLGECDGSGYVTRRYADERQALSGFELNEVRRNYPELFPSEALLTEAEIMKHLGF